MNEEGEINLDGDQGAALPFQTAFMQTFLPLGYPESVKKEYLEYQVWDSVQALSSYIRGVLSSRFVFQGLGVGDEHALCIPHTIETYSQTESFHFRFDHIITNLFPALESLMHKFLKMKEEVLVSCVLTASA